MERGDNVQQQSEETSSLPDFPANLLDFQRMFPNESECLKYLERLRWPGGFKCEKCTIIGEPFRIVARPRVLKCRSCLHETSLTAGTIMHRSKISIHVWFWAAYMVATQTPGISAMEVQKKLGILCYETAFQLMHKLRAVMVRPNRDKIGAEWPLEMDIAFVGGKHKSGVQGKTDKVPVIIAVEVRRKEIRDPLTGKILQRGVAGRIRLEKLSNKSAASVDKFANACIAPGATIVSDDGTEFANLLSSGYRHQPIPMRGDRSKMDVHIPMVSTVTANLKTWLNGTFHGVWKHHLQAYLNEFMFRFNRRFYRQMSFRTLLGLGAFHSSQTYQELYDVAAVQLEN